MYSIKSRFSKHGVRYIVNNGPNWHSMFAKVDWDREEEIKATQRIRQCQNYPTTQMGKVKKKVHLTHHLGLIPGILSPSSASPPECRFLPPPFTGEFPTKVGPLETGLP